MNAIWEYLNKTTEDAATPTRKRNRAQDRLSRREVREIINRNVLLIKTVSFDMLDELAKRIHRVLNDTMDSDRLIDWLIDECGVTESQAYLIVTDQIRKAREQMKITDWKNRGIEFAMWRHRAGVNEPRDYHLRDWNGRSGIRSGKPNGLNGFVFRLDDPPVIDTKTGERGYPSSLIGCQCYLTGIRA